MLCLGGQSTQKAFNTFQATPFLWCTKCTKRQKALVGILIIKSFSFSTARGRTGMPIKSYQPVSLSDVSWIFMVFLHVWLRSSICPWSTCLSSFPVPIADPKHLSMQVDQRPGKEDQNLICIILLIILSFYIHSPPNPRIPHVLSSASEQTLLIFTIESSFFLSNIHPWVQ